MQSNWESYKYFLQSVRSGSMKKAARVLGIDYTTVYRHIKNLENKLGSKLFKREGRDQKITNEGQLLYEKLQIAEDQLFSAESLFMQSKSELRGRVRLSTSDTVAMCLIPNLLKQFNYQYPEIKVDVTMDLKYVRLEKKEADVAISVGMGHPDTLLGYPLAKIKMGLYGHHKYKIGSRNIAGLKELPWITLNERLSHLGSSRWISEHIPEALIQHRLSHFILVHEMIKAGLGVSLIPDYLADHSLERHPDFDFDFGVEFWVVYHPDLKDVKRVNILVQSIRQIFERSIQQRSQ